MRLTTTRDAGFDDTERSRKTRGLTDIFEASRPQTQIFYVGPLSTKGLEAYSMTRDDDQCPTTKTCSRSRLTSLRSREKHNLADIAAANNRSSAMHCATRHHNGAWRQSRHTRRSKVVAEMV